MGQERRPAGGPAAAARKAPRPAPSRWRRAGLWVASWPPGLLAGLLAGAGFVAAGLAYSLGLGGSPAIRRFTGTGEFRIWVSLIALQVGMWGALTPGLVRMNARLRGELGPRASGWRPRWQDASYMALLALLVGVLFGGGGPELPIPDALAPRNRSLVVLGLLVAAPILTGVWLLQETVTRLGTALAAAPREVRTREVTWEATGREAFAAVVGKRAVLQRFLLAGSLIIGTATLAAGALRFAVLAADPKAVFPATYPLLYGGLFTVILAFVYVPAYLSWQRVGNGLLEACWPVPLIKPGKDWHEGRQAASAALGLTVSAKDSFQAGAAIVAPLLTSIVTVLLPGAGA